MNTVVTETNGRLPDGTFAPGNQAACGHKRRQHMAKLRAAFTEAVTPEDVHEIVSTLVRQAKDGCAVSAKLVLDRALGKLSSLDSEDPPPDAPPTIKEQITALGPVTQQNLAQHKALRLAELDNGTW